MLKSDCTSIMILIEKFLVNDLDSADQSRLMDHLASCEICNAVFSHKMISEAKQDSTGFQDMTAEILKKTTGSVCSEAEIEICREYDCQGENIITDQTNPLLRQHLNNCSDCMELAQALPRTINALKTETIWEPDDQFVPDIMANTTKTTWGFALALGRRIKTQTDNLILTRPRIALESAYIFTLIFVLLFHWTGISPSQASAPFNSGRTSIIQITEKIDQTLSQLSGQVQNKLSSLPHSVTPLKESIISRGQALLDTKWEIVRTSALAIWTTILRYSSNVVGWLFKNMEDSNGNQSHNRTNER
ncbi:zf-HC2 domain-containing protein [bacterium]|nr:zf-HC2 domain-containing protein [bacterium]